ncbi:MAG: prolipoprotein diacylglyceryl transferase, partial [bacterium]|nr:prolipoprotein diacylglyceryl transferase [bacterium]
TAPSPTLPLNRGRGAALLNLADISTVPVALGLALGRVGNIINQEFGIYPYYEATGDVLISVVCYMFLRVRGGTSGMTFAIFLLLYSILRFSLEYIRPQDWSLVFGLSRGQLLTIPLFLLAVILLKNAYKHRVSKTV